MAILLCLHIRVNLDCGFFPYLGSSGWVPVPARAARVTLTWQISKGCAADVVLTTAAKDLHLGYEKKNIIDPFCVNHVRLQMIYAYGMPSFVKWEFHHNLQNIPLKCDLMLEYLQFQSLCIEFRFCFNLLPYCYYPYIYYGCFWCNKADKYRCMTVFHISTSAVRKCVVTSHFFVTCKS